MTGNSNNVLSFLHLNARSLSNKTDKISLLLSSISMDFSVSGTISQQSLIVVIFWDIILSTIPELVGKAWVSDFIN